MPPGDGPFPTVLMCGGLDALQSDNYSLFERYLAPLGIAMLTLDMPSIGFSSKWKLTQDSSFLHQHVLRSLPNVPWVDHTRVAAFGFRFGGQRGGSPGVSGVTAPESGGLSWACGALSAQ